MLRNRDVAYGHRCFIWAFVGILVRQISADGLAGSISGDYPRLVVVLLIYRRRRGLRSADGRDPPRRGDRAVTDQAPIPVGTGPEPSPQSGWRDSNPRPLRPERKRRYRSCATPA